MAFIERAAPLIRPRTALQLLIIILWLFIQFPVTTSATIVATHNSENEGDIITLTCEGTVHPSKFIPQLNDGSDIVAEWMGPEEVPLTEQNRIIVGFRRRTTSGVVHSLTLNGTSYTHAGTYTCQVALNFTNSLSHRSVAKYYLLVRSKYCSTDLYRNI